MNPSVLTRKKTRSGLDENLWKYLRGYSFRVRWRDPCAYSAEVHGALLGRFGEENSQDRRGTRGGEDDSYPFVFVTTPQSEADLPRICDAAREGIAKYGDKLIVIVVTKWFNEAASLRALKRALERMGVDALIKSTPEPLTTSPPSINPRPGVVR